ncbi:minor capsid protein [Lactobacillus phage phig1e]|uniref:minor capsid protein n=1 Tax=Lactobacillus phage phig1e TaxID=52979 RepID=UPI000009AF65|nr:minor capsid protein [Lactobacillus phage phig1e]CAA62098.1 capsid protein [Lactobacillus phage phig1e]CAA66748.1 minor capsid protein [Lactobacillus phage phig1e]
MQTLTYVIGQDRRTLVKDIQNFKIDFSDTTYNWVQARQYERTMRQLFVNVKNEDGTPYDLTGCNVWFQGKLPDNTHRIIDAKHSVMIDPTNGQFRFDLPAQAFAVAGSYVQAFFRIMRNGNNLATLEFNLEVLADTVISGLIPADYITPFEDLYDQLETIFNNADGDLKAKLSEWEDKLTTKFSQWSSDYDTIQAAVTAIKSQVAALVDKIATNGLLTVSEFQEAIKPINDLLVGKVSIDESLDIGGKIDRSWATQVDDFIAKLPAGGFKLAIVSDSHYEDLYDESSPYSYPYTADAFKHLNAFNRLGNAVNVMIAAGDNVNGLDGDVQHTIADGTVYATKLLQTSMTADKYVLLGNHDDNSPQLRLGNLYSQDVITDDQFKAIYQTSDLINGENRSDGSLYFYKDYQYQKVRLIGLNSFDVPEGVTNTDGTVKYPRYLISNYSQNQINWLANVALKNIPADYQIVVVTHAPLPHGYSLTNEIRMYNQTIVEGLLNAVATGTSYSGKSDTGTPEECQVSIVTDYNPQGPRPIAGFFGGHVHQEIIKPLDHFTNCVVLADANTDQGNVGTINELGITVVTIDTANRKVTLNGLGRATDRQFTY